MQGHIWAVSINLGSSADRLLGETTTTFGSKTQKAVLNNIGITEPGIYSLEVDVTSTNREYVLVAYTRVTVPERVTKKIRMTFEADFATFVINQEDTFSDAFKTEIVKLFNDEDISITNIELETGD